MYKNEDYYDGWIGLCKYEMGGDPKRKKNIKQTRRWERRSGGMRKTKEDR